MESGSGDLAIQAFGHEVMAKVGRHFYVHGDLDARMEFHDLVAPKFIAQGSLMEPLRSATDDHMLAEARQWLENVGALPFCQKYWGKRWSLTSFADIETAIEHRNELEKTFDGNEGLGRISVALGGHLGLLPQGDLPQRCFERLAEHGLTRSGWKLLAKLDDPFRTLWRVFQHDRTLAYTTHSSTSLDLDIPGLAENSAPEISPFEEGVMARVRARNSLRSLNILCAGATAAALVNAPPPRLRGKHFVDQSPGSKRWPKWPRTPRRCPRTRHGLACSRVRRGPPQPAGWFLRPPGELPGQRRSAARASRGLRPGAEIGSFADLAGLAPKQAWAKFGAMEAEWHERVQRRERGECEAITWEPLFATWPPNPARSLAFRELSDGGELFDEGKALHHCVSSYAELCKAGERRILSLSRDGARAGTLELIRDEEAGWTMGQFNTYSNSPVRDEACLELAVAAIKEACRAQAELDAAAGPELSGKIKARRDGAGWVQEAAPGVRA